MFWEATSTRSWKSPLFPNATDSCSSGFLYYSRSQMTTQSALCTCIVQGGSASPYWHHQWVHVHWHVCVESFLKTYSYCKKNKTTSSLDVDEVSPQFCPSVAWNKTICPKKLCLKSCYRKYDSKHFKTQSFSFLWHALGLCWINRWQSQGPGSSLVVGFLPFFFSPPLFTVLVT